MSSQNLLPSKSKTYKILTKLSIINLQVIPMNLLKNDKNDKKGKHGNW